jgi:hypothetical protein
MDMSILRRSLPARSRCKSAIEIYGTSLMSTWAPRMMTTTITMPMPAYSTELSVVPPPLLGMGSSGLETPRT